MSHLKNSVIYQYRLGNVLY